MRFPFLATFLAIQAALLPSTRAGERAQDPRPPQAAIATAPAAAPVARTPPFTGPLVKLRLTNLAGQGVNLSWLAPNGTLMNRGLLPPTPAGGTPAVFETRGGHRWLFRAGGRVLRQYAVTDQPVQDVVIGPAPAELPPVATGPASTMQVLPAEAVMRGPIPVAVPVLPLKVLKEVKRAPREAQEFLLVHNQERHRLGLPPLRWSGKLARYARKWAEHLAPTGELTHRTPRVLLYGENLSRGRAPAEAARRWLAERDLYRGQPIERQDLPVFGHYTQMIWKRTTKVGFAVAQGPKGLVVVANYAPGGNRSGAKPY